MDDHRDDALFRDFREDHTVLGRGFYELGTALRGGDLEHAADLARRIDRQAGAHITFEEEEFYPTLRRFLREAEVDVMYREHEAGLDVIRTLVELPPGAPLSDERRRELVAEADEMSKHIVECGELFGALGRIPADERGKLHRRMLELRLQGRRWTVHAARHAEAGA